MVAFCRENKPSQVSISRVNHEIKSPRIKVGSQYLLLQVSIIYIVRFSNEFSCIGLAELYMQGGIMIKHVLPVCKSICFKSPVTNSNMLLLNIVMIHACDS